MTNGTDRIFVGHKTDRTESRTQVFTGLLEFVRSVWVSLCEITPCAVQGAR